MTRIDGHSTVTLPASYVAEHVRLGYAATEPGNQSDTQDHSITLATTTTTSRGLYVAMTRGRHTNHVYVATDTTDPTDARDLLEHILHHDPTDTPATALRRQLLQEQHLSHARGRDTVPTIAVEPTYDSASSSIDIDL